MRVQKCEDLLLMAIKDCLDLDHCIFIKFDNLIISKVIEDGGSSTSSSGSSSGYGSQSAIKLDEPSTSNEGMSTKTHLKKCGILLICSYYSDPISNSTLLKLTKLGKTTF